MTLDQRQPPWERVHFIGFCATTVGGEKTVLRVKFVDTLEKC